ncbi:hypothetical protein QBC39DRAFT_72441 [Podospora conica]|nr:hypothetical protein QBC39DRAFT_72441 [Schizothecium conicum]
MAAMFLTIGMQIPSLHRGRSSNIHRPAKACTCKIDLGFQTDRTTFAHGVGTIFATLTILVSNPLCPTSHIMVNKQTPFLHPVTLFWLSVSWIQHGLFTGPATTSPSPPSPSPPWPSPIPQERGACQYTVSRTIPTSPRRPSEVSPQKSLPSPIGLHSFQSPYTSGSKAPSRWAISVYCSNDAGIPVSRNSSHISCTSSTPCRYTPK